MTLEESDWTEENFASCISIVEGVSPDEAVHTISGGSAQRFSSREEAEAWSREEDEDDPHAVRIWVAAGDIDGRTFVWEDNGFGGSDENTAERLSFAGAFVSMYWNVNSLMTFTFAKKGRVEMQFEALYAPDDDQWRLFESEGATRVADDDWEEAPEAHGLALQAQLLGLPAAVGPALLDDPDVEYWGTSY